MAYGGHDTPQMALDRALREGVVQKESGSSYFCNVCKKSLSSKDTIKSHLKSQKHLKETALDTRASDDLPVDFGRREAVEQRSPGESYYCETCDKYLKTKNTLKAHLLTKTHTNKLQNFTRYDSQREIPKAETVKLQREPPREPAYESTATRSQQENGGKEKPQMALDRAIRERVVEERDGSSYFCNTCLKSLKSKATIKSHLTSQTHIKLQSSTHYDSNTRPETAQARSKLPRVPAHKSTLTSPQVKQNPGLRKCYDSVDPVERAFAKGILSKLEDGKADGGSFRCNVCNQNLKVFGKLKAHLSSKKHNDKTSGSQYAHYEQEDEEGENSEEDEEVEEEEEETEEEETEEEETEEDEKYEDDSDLVSKSLRDGTLTDNPLKNPKLPYWCNICMQPLKQYGRLAFHLESKKHKAKVTVSVPQGENLKAGFERRLIKEENFKAEPLVHQQQWIGGAVTIKTKAEPSKYLPVKKEDYESLKILALGPPLKMELMQTKPPLHSLSENEENFVYFDLETGGLSTGVDILQIAAKCNRREFNEYVTPTKPISSKASQINGLRNRNGTLEKRVSDNPEQWQRLSTQPITNVLQEFCNWLEFIRPCYLVAHNAPFDKRHLLYHVNESHMMPMLTANVRGIIDTLPFFRKLYPQFKKDSGKKNLSAQVRQTSGKGHSLPALMDQILHETFDAHDALADIRALKRLIDITDCSTLLEHMKPI